MDLDLCLQKHKDTKHKTKTETGWSSSPTYMEKINHIIQKVAEYQIHIMYLHLDFRLGILVWTKLNNTQCANCQLFVLHCTADQYLAPAWPEQRIH